MIYLIDQCRFIQSKFSLSDSDGTLVLLPRSSLATHGCYGHNLMGIWLNLSFLQGERWGGGATMFSIMGIFTRPSLLDIISWVYGYNSITGQRERTMGGAATRFSIMGIFTKALF